MAQKYFCAETDSSTFHVTFVTSCSKVFTNKLFVRLIAIYLLVHLAQEKFPHLAKLERTGISADTTETTQTKMAQVHGLN